MAKSLKKKLISLGISLTIIASSLSQFVVVNAADNFDYSTALKDSIIFYDANKCGKDVKSNQFFSWRGPCHTEDGKDVGVDLTGGFHDAGDHVKFGLPQGYTAATMAWAVYEFKSAFDSTGNTDKMLDTLKYFTDYFLRSHPTSNVFYYQCGEGEVDHTYWGAPEEQTNNRPTYAVANSSKPASDVLGETSAALSIMSMIYKSKDSSYASKCLVAAKNLHSMGKTNKGVGEGQSFYAGSSYGDDLAWSAIWLYEATKDSTYLNEAKELILLKNKKGEDQFKNKWGMCWDDMYVPAFLKLAEITGDQLYKDAITYNLDYWLNSLTTTPGGMKYLMNWGVLRYNASASMIALLMYRQTGNTNYKDFAQKQIDYTLGKNPANMSYIVGFGSNYPKHPHHRAANGYTYANGDNAKPAKNLLVGALVGGPDQNDKYVDDVNQYQYTEVAIDYNAGLVGALAGLIQLKNGVPPTTKVTPTVTPTLVTDFGTGNDIPKMWKLGDPTQDSRINTSDSALIARVVLGMNNLATFSFKAADINGDNKITSTDVALLERYILGQEIQYKVGTEY